MRFRYGAHFCCLYRILLSQDGSSGCTNVYMKAFENSLDTVISFLALRWRHNAEHEMRQGQFWQAIPYVPVPMRQFLHL